MTAIDTLKDKVKQINSSVILGLDARPDYIPNCIRKKYGGNMIGLTQSIIEYCVSIIDSVKEVIPAIKVQYAYFQMLGVYGIDAYKVICDYAKEAGLMVISDIKVSDTTIVSKAYSNAFLGKTDTGSDLDDIFNVDFVTINPYYGSDTLKPFLQDCKTYGKGIFIIVKTANASAAEIQNLELKDGRYLYEKVASLVNEWCETEFNNCIGAIVGASSVEEYSALREIMPNTMFLVPSYSDKKNTAELLKYAYNSDGSDVIVNTSKQALTAYKSELWSTIYKEEEFAEATKAEIVRIRDSINKVRKN